MKKVFILTIGLLVLLAGYLYASPYLALNGIKNAAQERDAEKISGYIDFPSVKQGVKDQFKAKIATELVKEDDNDGFEALGSMFATAMIDPLVDGLITPEGIAAMMVEEEEQDITGKDTQAESNDLDNVEYDAGYTSFNSFDVDIYNKEGNNPVKIVLHRDGLSWKVTNINLPLDDF